MKRNKKSVSLLLCAVMISSLLPTEVFAAESHRNAPLRHDANQDDITISKTLEGYDKNSDSFKMKLHISGKDVIQTSDVALIVDCSGSMNEGNISFTETTRKKIYQCKICGQEFDKEVDSHSAITGYKESETNKYYSLISLSTSPVKTKYFYLYDNNYYSIYSYLEDNAITGRYILYFITDENQKHVISRLSLRDLSKEVDFKVYEEEFTVCDGELEEKMINTTQNKRGSKADAAKAAVKDFIYHTLGEKPDGRTRIGIVSYSDHAKIVCDFSYDISQLETAVSSIYAGGGTHIQSGIKKARDMLEESTANIRNAVLLSDGEPTYSYECTQMNGNYVQLYGGYLYDNMKYDYNSTVGNGGEFSLHRAPYNNGIPAIYESKLLKNISCDRNQTAPVMYSIAFGTDNQTDSTFFDIMKRCATDETKFYKAGSKIGNVFTEISGKVLCAAKNAAIEDPIGKAFTLYDLNADGILDADDITVKIGERELTRAEKDKMVSVSYMKNHTVIDENRKVVEIAADGNYFTINGFSVKKDEDVEISYRIKIKDGFFPFEDGDFDTNGRTTIYYRDSEDYLKSKDFDVPNVSLYTGKIKVVAVRSTQDGLGFITENGRKTDNIEEAKVLDEYYLTENGYDRFLLHSYLTVSKTVTGSSRDDGVLTGMEYNGNHVADNSVTVVLDKNNLSPTVYVKYYIPEKETKLKIIKAGCEDCDADQSFLFTVKSQDGKQEYTVEINGNDSVTVAGLEYGTYTVSEKTDWSWRYLPQETKTVALTAENPIVTVTVNNTRMNHSWLSGDDSCVNKFAREAVECE